MTATTRPATAGNRLVRALASTSSPGLLELSLVMAGLVLLTAAVYGNHAIEGGFLSDDWALHANAESGGDFFGTFDRLIDGANMKNRPLMAVYMAFTHTVLGEHMGFHLALAAGLAALMGWSVYLLLRLLAFERLHAGLIAALLVVFPAADAPRLWAGAAAGQLTVFFFVLALALAVLAFRSEGRRALLLHGASVVLYLSSILLHESTLIGIGAAVLLYVAVAGWSRGLKRWVVDVASASLVVLLVTMNSSGWPRQSFDGQVDHARTIFDEGWELLASVVFPLGGLPRLLVLVPLLLLPLAGLMIARRLRHDDLTRVRLLRWSAAVGAGFVVVVVAYLIYVPAISYYTPAATGIANRMNTLASIGFVLIAYGSIVLAATLVSRSYRRQAAIVAAVGVVGATVLGIGYLDRVADDSRRFEHAYALGADLLGRLQQAVPDPPPGATIYSAGQAIEVEPGFPVFGNTWDLTGAVEVKWNDDALTGLPFFPGTTFACHRRDMEPINARYGSNGSGADAFRSSYGKTVLFHAPSGRTEVIRSREQCEAAATWFQAGPEYAPPEA